MSEMQEQPVLTPEQQQRAEAVLTASNVLRGTESAKAPLTGRGEQPGNVVDIVDLSHYIVTGDTYSIAVSRAERDLYPMLIGSLDVNSGFLSDLIERLHAENETVNGDSDDKGQPEDEDLLFD